MNKKLLTICLSLLLLSTPLMAKDKTITLHIVETTDVHGAFFPYNFITRKPKAGSLARVSSYFVGKRRYPARTAHLLLL